MHLQVTPNWWPLYSSTYSSLSYFLSYRVAILMDGGLEAYYTNNVSIHIFNGSVGNANGYLPELEAGVLPGTTWDQPM